MIPRQWRISRLSQITYYQLIRNRKFQNIKQNDKFRHQDVVGQELYLKCEIQKARQDVGLFLHLVLTLWIALYPHTYKRSFGKTAVKVEPGKFFPSSEMISRYAPCCIHMFDNGDTNPRPVPPVWRLRALSTR